MTLLSRLPMTLLARAWSGRIWCSDTPAVCAKANEELAKSSAKPALKTGFIIRSPVAGGRCLAKRGFTPLVPPENFLSVAARPAKGGIFISTIASTAADQPQGGTGFFARGMPFYFPIAGKIRRPCRGDSRRRRRDSCGERPGACYALRRRLGAGGGAHADRRVLFPDGLRHRHCRTGPRSRGARLRFALRAGTHPYPGQPPHPVPRRRRAAEALFAYLRSVRRPVLRRGGDEEIAGRHRHLPDSRARPDRHRKMRRQPRPAVGRALRLRHRRRLERRGDGKSRRPLQHPFQIDARAHPGDEGDLDRGGGPVPRRDGRFRPDLVVAEADPAAAPADPARRRERLHAAPRRRILRRLVPAPAPRHGHRPRGRPAAGDGRPRRARFFQPVHLGVPRPGRPGCARRIRRRRGARGGARNSGQEPRRNPRRHRRLRPAADMSDAKLREAVCAIGASLFNRGLTAGSSGNISVKTADGWLMTPTNASLGRLDPARLSQLDHSGRLLGGDPPTKESFLHRVMYEERQDTGAVVHLHSTHSVAVSCLAEVNPHDVLPPITAYYVMRVGRLPLVPYFKPGDLALAEAVRGFAGRHHAVLLANHGPVVAGSSLDAAVNAIEELEETARLYLLLRGAKTRFLTPEQVKELL